MIDIEFRGKDVHDGKTRVGDLVRKTERESVINYEASPRVVFYIVDWTSETWEHYEVDPMTIEQTKYLDR